MAASDDGIFVLGNYKLLEVLGIGAMGYVYRAHQQNLDRDVAVKILSPKLAQESGYFELFMREARTAAALEHPHIVPVFDYGVQYEVSYVAMRLLLGSSLDERIQYRLAQNLPLPSLPEIISILTQAASALDYAHARGVIHRDIKPTNLMFDQHGVMYIVDFGIAKLIGTTSSNKGGTFLGTPSFMAPEQWEGLAPTPAVDQYALGAVIYMMLTGHPPFESDTALALMTKHLKETPKDIQYYRPNAPFQINEVLRRAMAKRPDERYPNAMAFAQAFVAAVQDTTGEKPTEFTTYALPHTNFSLPFPTPTRLPEPLSTADATPVIPSPSTRRAALPRGRNLILWIETGLLLLAIVLIIVLIVQRSDRETMSTPTPLVVAALPSATPTLPATGEPAPLRDPRNNTSSALMLLATASLVAPTQTDTAVDPPSPTDDPPTSTDTSTPLPTPTATMTFTPTVTDTATLLPTATFTPSDIPTLTFTATLTASPTATLTDTPQPSETPTATDTASPVPTATVAPSDTPTMTLTFTLTPSNTPSPTATLTFTATFTPSPTATDTPTDTPTPTPTPAFVARPNVPWHNGSHLKIINTNGAWLRAHPSARSAQIATLAYNNLVTATGNDFFDGRQWWWEVRASWGAVGWVEQYSLVEQ